MDLTLTFAEVCRELDNAGYSEERIAYMTGETVNRVATTLDRLDGLRAPLERAPSIEPVNGYAQLIDPNPTYATARGEYGTRTASGFGRTGNGHDRELAPCGTAAAYRRHSKQREPIDEACRTAERLYRAERRVINKRTWS